MSANHPAKADPRRWRRLRLRIFDRDGWRCLLCGRPARLECDHVRPVEAGGAWWDPANLQTLCWRCHLGKSRRERSRAMRTPGPGESAWQDLVDSRLDTP